MEKVVKKSFMSVVACLMACMMFAMSVFAASNNFSKTTVKLNAINGGGSKERVHYLREVYWELSREVIQLNGNIK